MVEPVTWISAAIDLGLALMAWLASRDGLAAVAATVASAALVLLHYRCRDWVMEAVVLRVGLAAYQRCWAPTETAGAVAFAFLRHKTQCIFAPRAVVWGNEWDEEASLEANAERFARQLRWFFVFARGRELDGAVFEGLIEAWVQ